MKKIHLVILCLFLLFVILCLFLLLGTGCNKLNSRVLEKPLEPTIISNATNPNSQPPSVSKKTFDFQLPIGYKIDNITDTDCTITHGNDIVGGFILTDLDADVISDPNNAAIINYLESFVIPPLDYEYMMGYSDASPSIIEISLNIIDLTNMESHEYKHYLFRKESNCVDLWFDTKFLDSNNINQILVKTEIDKFAE